MKRDPRTALVAILTVALVAGVVPSLAAGTLRFRGSGWGHGIGLSQYGAFGLAKKGWGATKIVRHFYKGVNIAERQPPKSKFRVGLLQNRGSFTIAAEKGAYTMKVSGNVVHRVREGRRRKVLIRSGQFRVEKPNGNLVGVFGDASNPLQVQRSSGGVVRTIQWGHALGRGSLQLKIVGNQSAHLVAVLDPEQYLYGLGEVPSSWPMGALGAQAIPARTYAYRVVAGGRSGCACDILGDTRDQAYVGWDKEAGASGGRWVKAVRRTKRKVALSGGQPISAFYSSSSGGFTENIENVWTGASPQPYLKGVCDPGDYVSANPNRVWSTGMSGGEVASRLGRPGGMRRATKIQVLERGVSGRVVRARVVGKDGSGDTVSANRDGWDLRGALGLRDTRFWVNQNRNITGPIRNKYDNLRCRPGPATSKQKKTNGGNFQRFKSGRIYWKDGAGARWLKGAILKKYLRVGGPGGRLGFPKTDVRKISGGRLKAKFQGGVIICKTSTGPCRVRYG